MKNSTLKSFIGQLPLLGLSVLLVASAGFAENRGQNNSQVSVHLWDYCDPTTFNAALGPDTCNRDTTTGAITVNGFLGEVTSDKSAGAWRFSPAEVNSKRGKITFALQNVGGETHTFTRVKRFGGGFVDALNQASGNPVPAPECAQSANGMLTPQPASANNIFLAPGATATASTSRHDDTVRYQCCIHPWMRLVVDEKDDHGHDH